jgi:hypothetical protein
MRQEQRVVRPVHFDELLPVAMGWRRLVRAVADPFCKRRRAGESAAHGIQWRKLNHDPEKMSFVGLPWHSWRLGELGAAAEGQPK